jgi:hypothetical protein
MISYLMGFLYDVQREVDAAKAKVQQVLQLKDAYSQALSCTTSSGFTSFQEPAVNSSTVKVSLLIYMVLLIFEPG